MIIRNLGVRLVIYMYINDILIIVEKRKQERDHTLGLVYLMKNMSFIIHPVKSLTEPTQELDSLRVQVDSIFV